jgi:hypothetical protein
MDTKDKALNDVMYRIIGLKGFFDLIKLLPLNTKYCEPEDEALLNFASFMSDELEKIYKLCDIKPGKIENA